MAYLLDTDVFIQAKNLHYGFDFCPAFWDWIDERHAAGAVLSIEKVRDELIGGGDDLATWARQRQQDFFLTPDAAVLPSLRTASAWAASAGYEPAAVNIFLSAHEVPSSSTRKIKIPDACIGLSVKCMTPFQMLRAEGARFILGRTT